MQHTHPAMPLLPFSTSSLNYMLAEHILECELSLATAGGLP